MSEPILGKGAGDEEIVFVQRNSRLAPPRVQLDQALETYAARLIAQCANAARQQALDETGDQYLANRVWRAVADAGKAVIS